MVRSLLPVVLATTVLMPGVLQAQQETDPNSARVVRLEIKPSRLDNAAKNLALLPKAEELTKGNGASLYLKAVEALPADLDMYPVWGWRDMPLRDLPRDEVQAVLETSIPKSGGPCDIARYEITVAR